MYWENRTRSVAMGSHLSTSLPQFLSKPLYGKFKIPTLPLSI